MLMWRNKILLPRRKHHMDLRNGDVFRKVVFVVVVVIAFVSFVYFR